MSSALPALQALSPDDLVRRFPMLTLAEARKIVALAHRGAVLPAHAPAGVRRGAFAEVRAGCMLPRLELAARVPSQIDPFVKYTVRSPLGGTVETVRIPLERVGRFSVCVSSQLGCALGCHFCATGRLGFVRNLDAWEIIEQVRTVREDLPPGSRIHGAVFQGMGEPLANVGEVLQAARLLSEPCALAIDAKCITVCTAGLPNGILRLAREAPNVRLALSIGSARSSVRSEIMPVETRHPLTAVLEAAGEHALQTGHAPLWAYTLLPGVNDHGEDATALAAAFHNFASRFQVRPRVTLVPYNPTRPAGQDPFRRATGDEENAFWDALAAHGVRAKRRYSGGMDVGAACGQLVADQLGASKRAPDREATLGPVSDGDPPTVRFCDQAG